jgi:hypothetical protein
MNGFLCFLWGVLGFLAALGTTVLGGMISQEVRDRLDHLPHAILRLAACRLTPGQRSSIYQDEWVPELTYILKEADARPITRLIIGTRYALGILNSADRISRRLDGVTTDQELVISLYNSDEDIAGCEPTDSASLMITLIPLG